MASGTFFYCHIRESRQLQEEMQELKRDREVSVIKICRCNCLRKKVI